MSKRQLSRCVIMYSSVGTFKLISIYELPTKSRSSSTPHYDALDEINIVTDRTARTHTSLFVLYITSDDKPKHL